MTKKLIGTLPYQTPRNADLGTLAYQDADYLNLGEVSLKNVTVTPDTGYPLVVKTNHSGSPTAMSIGDTSVINGVSFSAQPFYILNVAKDSGSGKSTFFNGNVGFASGSGIDFSATGQGSWTTGTDSQIFDDYEEGRWVPNYRDAAGGTYTGARSSSGFYTKSGNIVTATFELIATQDLVSNGLSGVETIEIDGLPYNNNSNHFSFGAITNSAGKNWNSGSGQILGPLVGYRNSNKMFIRLWSPSTTGTNEASLTVAQANYSSRLTYGTVIYRTA